MKRVLFDTDVLIDLLRGKPSTFDQVSEIIFGNRLCCSVITVAEIYAGMFPQEKDPTDQLLDALEAFPVSISIAQQAGSLRSQYPGRELMDCLIAATALQHHAQLVTKNVKHYPMKELMVISIR